MAGVADAGATTSEGVLSPPEKFALRNMHGTESSEVSEVIHDSEHDAKGVPRPQEDVLRLSDVPEAKKFLLQSKEFMWLPEQVTNSASFLQTGLSDSHARCEISRAMDERDGQLNLTLGWDVTTILNGQYPGDQKPSDLLSNVIVYIGSPSTCFATTASQYAQRVWRSVALQVLESLELAISDSNGESMICFEGVCMQVKLNGVKTFIKLNSYPEAREFGSRKAILEVAELCIWLVSACCDNTGHDVVGISSPILEVIENEPGSAATLVVIPSITPDTHAVTQKGQCWTAMVLNPIICSGYPVPKRDDASKTSGL